MILAAFGATVATIGAERIFRSNTRVSQAVHACGNDCECVKAAVRTHTSVTYRLAIIKGVCGE